MTSIQEQIYQAIPSSFAAGLGAVAMRDRFKESINEFDMEDIKSGAKAGVKWLKNKAEDVGSGIKKAIAEKPRPVSTTPFVSALRG